MTLISSKTPRLSLVFKSNHFVDLYVPTIRDYFNNGRVLRICTFTRRKSGQFLFTRIFLRPSGMADQPGVKKSNQFISFE